MKLLLVVLAVKALAHVFGSKGEGRNNDSCENMTGHVEHPAGFAVR